MSKEIREYARLGLVHHLLYPSCMEDPDDHVETLLAFVTRTDIQTFDCCLPYGDARRAKLLPAIRESGKQDVAFATHLFPMRKLLFAAPLAHEQAQARMIVRDMIDQAAAMGATGFIFPSGGPPRAESGPEHIAAFRDFCAWLCGELKPFGITAMLEPFDTAIDKKFLYGPTKACVNLIESLAPEVDNLAIELDVAHLPLMGESFEHAIRTCAPHLARVHLGNCVLQDPTHPRYGDTHPPIGFPGGEVDTPELVGILRLLLDVGFLNERGRKGLLMEMTPWPGKSVEETVQDAWARLAQAWRQVQMPCFTQGGPCA